MEKLAYGILGVLVGATIVAMLIGVIRVWPYGLLILALLLGFGLLLIKSIKKDRRPNRETGGLPG